MNKSVESHSLLTDYDIYLLKSGMHFRLHEKLGSHPVSKGKLKGTYFGVWAPNAKYVSVVGDFNNWDTQEHPLSLRLDGSGIWEGFVPKVSVGEAYKYFLHAANGWEVYKGDPFARKWECPPETASIVWDDAYDWQDQDWMSSRKKTNSLDAPFAVYEIHLGSWKKPEERELSFFSYEEMARKLVPYVQEMGFTHVEFMPLMEHPYYPSWGYQIHGFFAPTSRHGDPEGLKYLIDCFHQAGIGVIMDWVPSHFPADIHGLYRFDGTALYEHEDNRKGYHPEWNSYIFNYGRNEVRSFLISNAIFWLEAYHIDGLRVDAIASIIFLDYAREDGHWIPNQFGGNENLEAIQFLKDLNTEIYRTFPDVQMIAEDSTAYPKVSRPIYDGGLGFGMKWMMGWMNDTLKYFKEDPINRKYHHGQITFSIVYAWSENFMLPLSHDEVVHGKASLLLKMPGDDWQKFANLRLLLGYMYMHPGAKLLFMGSEIGQLREWNHSRSIDWHLLEHISHRSIQDWTKTINHFYKKEKALYEYNFDEKGFDWLVVGEYMMSILAFMRKGKRKNDQLLVVMNMTPVYREQYQIGIPEPSSWKLVLNSDDDKYWGSECKALPTLTSIEKTNNGKNYTVVADIPPLSIIVYKRKRSRSAVNK